MDNPNLYEQEDHWGKLQKDALFLKKVRSIKALIPSDVQTILDAGCGDGALTNLLTDSQYKIMGLDRSKEALTHVRTEKMQASIDSIPVKGESFDLVICSQVLEHLPNEIYEKTVAELIRVSKKYLIIGLPYREKLIQNTTKCFNCGFRYHIWGHMRRYRSIGEIDKIFLPFKPVDHIFTNRTKRANTFLMWLRQNIAQDWSMDSIAICPKCNYKNSDASPRGSELLKQILYRIHPISKWDEEYWWSVTLFERNI